MKIIKQVKLGKQKYKKNRWISGSHRGDHKQYYFLVCDASVV
jgi:hypothetical protein